MSNAVEGFGKLIDGLVRPIVTISFVAAILYLGIMQHVTEAVGAIINLGIAVVSFWFGTRTADKAADAAIAVAKQAGDVATSTMNAGIPK